MSTTKREMLAVSCALAAAMAALASSPSHATGLTPRGDLEAQGPGLSVAIGGVGLGGLGNEAHEGGRALSVDIGGPVRTAYLYWGGRGVLPADDTIIVDGTSVQGELVGSETAPAATAFAYRANLTTLVQSAVVPPATLELMIDDPTPTDDNILDGASLLVIYDDPSDTTIYQLSVYDGSDFAWAPNLPAPAGFTEPVEFITVPEGDDRTGELIIVAGDAFPSRPDRILISGNPDVVNELDASDGLQWDSDLHEVELAQGTSRLTVELVSPPEAGPPADSMNWVLAVLRRPVQGTTDGFTGACCLEGGVCVVVSVDGCTVLGGAFQGPSTMCDPDPCPDPTGACCLANGSCVVATAIACDGMGGTYQGDDTACTPQLCTPVTGACCLPDGSCVTNTPAECSSAGGLHQGDGSTCGSVQCPEPMGACCFRDGSCGVGRAFDCLVAGGAYQGDGTTCDTDPCTPPSGACCLADGSCMTATADACSAAGGDYQGDDTTCGGVSCPQPEGACCLPSGSCMTATADGCAAAGGDYQGDDTTCGGVSCPQPIGACCFDDGSCVNTLAVVCDAMGAAFQGIGSTCAGVTCTQPTGACCFPDGSCSIETAESCSSGSGAYQGDATTCGGVSCPQPAGACCLDDGSCVNVTQIICNAMGGTFQGNATACTNVDCPQPKGACCLPDGSCTFVTAAQCASAGGDYRGDFTDCASTDCPQPTGACCLPDGSCVEVTQAECVAAGGDYQGNFSQCTGVVCPQPTGACCLPSGSCIVVTAEGCAAAGGDYQGNFTQCGDVDCPQPEGACCFPDGSCTEITQAACAGSGGDYQGDFTLCTAVDCPQPTGACCRPDGTCVEVTADECATAGGEFQGSFTTCDDVDCPEPIGACCLSDGSCQVLSIGDCLAMSGRFQGGDTSCADVECLRPTAGGCSEKGSLLVYSKVEVRWDGKGAIIRDTFIDISNDFPEDVRVLMYFINGDPPLPKCKDEGFDPKVECDDRAHPGWNWVDNEIMLTKNEPTYWSALTGQPKGVSPWQVLDPGMPAGRPALDGTDHRVLRGYILAWAIDAEGREIRWNHLKGDAVIVDYDTDSAWEYNACAYAVVDPTIPNGEQTGTPGILNLDGVEYAPAYDMLLMDFYASGATVFRGVKIETCLTLHVLDNDLRQESDGPVTTKAHFDVWNMNEVKFSGAYRCLTCWDETMLARYGVPNHFLAANLQTDKGKARINGLASQLCDYDNDPKDQLPVGASPEDVLSRNAALAGVVSKQLSFENVFAPALAGTNLHGMGTQSAVIRFDTLELPPEAIAPDDILWQLLDRIQKQLRVSDR